MKKCNESFQHIRWRESTIPLVSANSPLFVDTQRYDTKCIQSQVNLFLRHPCKLAIQQRIRFLQHSLDSFSRQPSLLALLISPSVSYGFLLLLNEKRYLFFVLIVARFIEVDLWLKMTTSFLLSSELAHNLFYLSQFMVELRFINFFLFPEDASDEHVVHVPLTDAKRFVLVRYILAW